MLFVFVNDFYITIKFNYSNNHYSNFKAYHKSYVDIKEIKLK